MDYSLRELLIKVERLKTILVSRATGRDQESDFPEYVELRQELVATRNLDLPTFVYSCRTLDEFWQFIKTEYSTYADRREYLREAFNPVLTFLDSDSHTAAFGGDLFKRQFPAGLPFGLKKPNLAFVPKKGSQTAYFEEETGIGVIRENVYPNFTYQDLDESLHGSLIRHPDLMSFLTNINQTESEKRFFTRYACDYNMQTDEVPALIPQAWIQWHSRTKRDLRSISSSYVDDLYRVDFVAFWKNKRFAILVDDISHYAKKISSRWDADEQSYSKRLKEDRKLRKEGWQVFRVSNWEMRREAFISEILVDLKEHIDF